MAERTYCRICEAACGLVAQRDHAGELVSLRPDREHPVSRGFVCAKGTRFAEVARHPERVLHPLRRGIDGRLERIPWSTAAKMLASRLRPLIDRHGPHAVAVYFGNPLAFNALGSMAMLALVKALGTRNVYSAGSQDCQNKFAGAELVHGSPFVHPIPDLDHAELVVVFGSNPAVSQASFVHLGGGSLAFDRLIERGGEVVWVDPRRTESAARWGEHLPIRPGTDAWLLAALFVECTSGGAYGTAPATGLAELRAALAAVTPELAAAATGVAADAIRTLARRIARRRTALHLSVGVNQGAFGTLAYVLLQALSCVTGNFDRQGGSLIHPMAPRLGRALAALGIGQARHESRVGGFKSSLDTLPGAILADEILRPGQEQIRALIVVSGDPLVSIPGEARLAQAFGSLDCLVSIDLFENNTARLADLVLPGTSWLERADFATTTLTFQTGDLLQWSGPVEPVPGECRHEARILLDLGASLGVLPPLGALLSRLSRLPLPGVGVPVRGPRAGQYLARGTLHVDRRLHFFSDDVGAEVTRLLAAPVRAPGGFQLVGRRRRLGHNAWLHGAQRSGDPERAAWLHPEDLRDLAVESGTLVAIRTAAGCIELPALAREGVARGTVVVPHGVPGASVNAIIPSGEGAVERISGQHVMTGLSVDIAPRAMGEA